MTFISNIKNMDINSEINNLVIKICNLLNYNKKFNFNRS